MKKAKRLAMCLLLLVLVFSALTVTALAAGETTPAAGGSGGISGVVTQTWTGVRGQIKTVCNSVVFPALTGGLVIWFLIECGTCYANYKKSHSVTLTGPIILFICSIIMATAPLYIWGAIGW